MTSLSQQRENLTAALKQRDDELKQTIDQVDHSLKLSVEQEGKTRDLTKRALLQKLQTKRNEAKERITAELDKLDDKQRRLNEFKRDNGYNFPKDAIKENHLEKAKEWIPYGCRENNWEGCRGKDLQDVAFAYDFYGEDVKRAKADADDLADLVTSCANETNMSDECVCRAIDGESKLCIFAKGRTCARAPRCDTAADDTNGKSGDKTASRKGGDKRKSRKRTRRRRRRKKYSKKSNRKLKKKSRKRKRKKRTRRRRRRRKR